MKTLTDQFEHEFSELHRLTLEVLDQTAFETLFGSAGDSRVPPGMLLIRSAAKVEQCFGGLTARLWDDPFEWTLAESFTDKSQVLTYLSEVEAACQRGFKLFNDDLDLTREIAAPVEMRTVFSVLIRAHSDAASFLAMARNEIGYRQ